MEYVRFRTASLRRKITRIKPSYCLLLGVDEAGYGPNLGPLVIACSAWLVRTDPAAETEARLESILDTLHPVFQPKPLKEGCMHVPLGDSKMLYAGAHGFDALSAGLLFWLGQLGCTTLSRDDVMTVLSPGFDRQVEGLAPWYATKLSKLASDDDRWLPLDELLAASVLERAQQRIDEIGLRLVGLTARVVNEASFNEGVDRFGNKASLLSYESLRLAQQTMEKAINHSQSLGARIASIHVYCDKHGGRNRYQAPLMHAMPDRWFHPLRESATRSDYRAERKGELPQRWTFLAKGDRQLGSALASMTAKWLREYFMASLNAFWRSTLPELTPTAGYPVDAWRFRREIEATASQLGLPVSAWWRSR